MLKGKSKVNPLLKKIHKMIETHFQAKVQALIIDNGKEYFNSILGTYLLENGIVHFSSCNDTPQQNGVAERKNRHLLEVGRALMFTKNVPKIY